MNNPLEAPEVAPAPQPQPVGVGSLQDTPDTTTGPSVDAVRLVADVLRQHNVGYDGTWAGETDFVDGVAAAVVAALGGLTRERDRRTKCECRHGLVDHDIVLRCQANSGSRRTPCECRQFRPAPRSRWVGQWIPKEAGDGSDC